TGSLTVQKGGTMTGDITHVGGKMSSNGVVVSTHTHGGVRTGDGNTGQPQ
ncbi:phage baseplate assembly protein V, partial [Salmonella enterica]|nr:phage baseplate assembly protein V [Salmonella enterica]